jgi:hypothetical protein
MNSQKTASVGGRDIYLRADGALTGDILTVACLIVWADDKSPIEGLDIYRRMLAGNVLPSGDLSSFNEYYDQLTGTYWFDIKVRPITEPTDVVIQARGFVHGTEIPVLFEMHIPGPSPLVVSPITFDGNIMRFEIGNTSGKLLQYPLSVKAVREIDGNAAALPSKQKRIPYAFYTPINNGQVETFAVMGMAEVDGVKHNWVARTEIKTNDGELSLEQKGENLLGVSVKLANPKATTEINLPVKFELGDGTYGIANQVHDYNQIDDVVYFDIPLSDIKDQTSVKVSFHLNETSNSNAPIFLMGQAPVKRWSNGQSKIKIEIDSHTFKRNVDTLYAHVFWEDGTPVKGFRLKNITPECHSGVKGNQIILSRKFVPNQHKENKLTLGATVDLTPFGIEEETSFEDILSIGSDILPIRVVSGLGTVLGDEVHFNIAVRQNNGDIFNDAVLDVFNANAKIKNQSYDKDSGIVSFTVPNTAINVIDERANVATKFTVTTDEALQGTFNGTIKIDVPYTIKADLPIWKYRRDQLTGRIYIDATWVLKGSDGNYPNTANIADVKLNGMGVTDYKKSYNQSFGALSLSFPVSLQPGGMLYVSATASASGLGNFFNLPALDSRYREPGTVRYVNHEFTEDNKVKVFFDVQGWDSLPPAEVQIEDNSWNRVEGVKYGKSYSEYDPKKGVLMVQFDLFDPNAPVFKGETSMKLNYADMTTYPISFSFTK